MCFSLPCLLVMPFSALSTDKFLQGRESGDHGGIVRQKDTGYVHSVS
jgi:hypothetical protein